MRLDTKKREKATRGFEKVYGREKLVDQMFQVFCKGKQGLDAFLLEREKITQAAGQEPCGWGDRD